MGQAINQAEGQEPKMSCLLSDWEWPVRLQRGILMTTKFRIYGIVSGKCLRKTLAMKLSSTDIPPIGFPLRSISVSSAKEGQRYYLNSMEWQPPQVQPV